MYVATGRVSNREMEKELFTKGSEASEVSTQLTSTGSWRFVEKAHTFPKLMIPESIHKYSYLDLGKYFWLVRDFTFPVLPLSQNLEQTGEQRSLDSLRMDLISKEPLLEIADFTAQNVMLPERSVNKRTKLSPVLISFNSSAKTQGTKIVPFSKRLSDVTQSCTLLVSPNTAVCHNE